MVGRSQNRRSNITVTVIDVEKLMADLYEQAKKAGKIPDDVVSIRPCPMKWAYIETPKGIFMLDDEACCPGGDERPITEAYSSAWSIYYHKENSVPMFPDGELRLSPDFIKGLDTKGEVNFGEWVRHFGSRIEVNFHNWNNHLEKLMGVQHVD